MRRLGLLMGLCVASTIHAAEPPCPVFKPGELYPWQKGPMSSGDRYAEMEVDIDASGKPLKCRIFKSNVDSETRLFMCQAVLAQGRYDPVMKDGAAVPGTVKTTMVMAGPRSRQRAAKARKEFFRNNPQERPSCYPE